MEHEDRKAEKKLLRKEMKSRLSALPPDGLRREGEAAARLLRETRLWQSRPVLLLFLSAPLEIDTAPLLEAAAADRKRIFLPKVEGEDITFYQVTDIQEQWESGAFGIQEPAATEGRKSHGAGDTPALIIVPGVAFDERGNRMGHGKGYYDRFFAKIAGSADYCYVGYCADIQVVSPIPTEPWDQPMDALCTGRRFLALSDRVQG